MKKVLLGVGVGALLLLGARPALAANGPEQAPTAATGSGSVIKVPAPLPSDQAVTVVQHLKGGVLTIHVGPSSSTMAGAVAGARAAGFTSEAVPVTTAVRTSTVYQFESVDFCNSAGCWWWDLHVQAYWHYDGRGAWTDGAPLCTYSSGPFWEDVTNPACFTWNNGGFNYGWMAEVGQFRLHGGIPIFNWGATKLWTLEIDNHANGYHNVRAY